MNGRIYDPNLGRFLSVDPVFEFPTNTQSLNPYSYVLNNPLSMTDPTGYVVDSCGTGKTSCPGDTASVTVKTTATELDSHIATHGMTTFTGTMDKAGNMQVTASGNGFGLGQTAEVSVDSHGGSNGAQNSSQGPATSLGLGTSSNQGANTAPASSGNVAQANAAMGSQGKATDPQPTPAIFSASGAAALRNGQSSDSSDAQELTYSTVGQGTMKQGTHYWTIDWKLADPSEKGGYIIQHIRSNEGDPLDYWEAWKVSKGSMVPDREPGAKYDDGFGGPKGIEVMGEARFYEGLELPKSFGHIDRAGYLPATTVNPNLPTSNATAPVTRWWDTNNDKDN